MRLLLAVAFLLFSTNSFGSGKSYSVTIKPKAGIVGTASFNIHDDNRITVLVYESPTKIAENMASVDAAKITEVIQLLESTIDELIEIKDYSNLPEFKQTSAVTVTKDKVTKSISTRRYTGQLIELIKAINSYIPKEYRTKLEKK